MNCAIAPRMLLLNSASLKNITQTVLSTVQTSSSVTRLSLFRGSNVSPRNKIYLSLSAQLSSRANFNFFRFRRANGLQAKPSLQEQLLINNSQKKQLSNQNQRPSTNNAGRNEATPTNSEAVAGQVKLSIFKRFKEAYKQHGKILIWTHVVTCCGWIVGLFFLSKG